MITAAWIALFAPAAAVVAIALAGTAISRSVAGFLAAGSALVACGSTAASPDVARWIPITLGIVGGVLALVLLWDLIRRRI